VTRIQSEDFGQLDDGRNTTLYTLTNTNGIQVSITDYGGTVTKIIVPDKNGVMGDVVLGYDEISGYLNDNQYFGSIIGRYGNRIAEGKFTLDGIEYSLTANDGPHHLHGGRKGFDKVLWSAAKIEDNDHVGLELKYTSPDGEEGYPGRLDVNVTYLLTERNELRIKYEAVTDKPTICNLTNHSYFNLKDGGKSTILDHRLMIDSDIFTPVNGELIPTGECMPIEDTPFDFREPTSIGSRINSDHKQMHVGPGGYDHSFLLNGNAGELRKAAVLSEPETGRILEVFTEEPAIQFYSGNFLDGTRTGKQGTAYGCRTGLCLETQHFPDSPNNPDLPSTVLNPGKTYRTVTVYTFSSAGTL